MGGGAELVKLPDSNSLATPWHPVRPNKKAQWVFPANFGCVEQQACNAVYNLLLDNEHVARIEGWECVTLAHGMKGDVIGHKYFGTQSVVNDLMRMKGWDNGKITYYSDKLTMRRDENTGRIVGMAYGQHQE